MDRVATLHGDRDSILRALSEGPAGLLYEVRLDTLWAEVPHEETAVDDLLSIVQAAEGKRLLGTLRPKRQGGAFEGDEQVRLGLLMAAKQAGFAAVDLEADLENPLAAARAMGLASEEFLVSDHNLPKLPTREEGMLLLQRLQDQRSRAEKIALEASNFMDVLRLLELSHQHAQRHGNPAVCPLGGGAKLRVLMTLAGSRMLYGSAPGLGPAVPGQPTWEQLTQVLDQWGLEDDDLDCMAGSPGWYAVVGLPIDHSLSPKIHNAVFRKVGWYHRYGALEVPDSVAAMRLLTSVLSRIGCRGLNVTAPLKVHALEAASHKDERASLAGAANTLRVRGTAVEATNTDVAAFETFLFKDLPLVILGAGGAARAAWAAAKTLGIPTTILCRNPKSASWAEGAVVQPWAHVPSGEYQVAQCSSAGDVDAARFDGARAWIELRYGSGVAKELATLPASCQLTDGRTFLIEQAVHAQQFWNPELDLDEARTVMQNALET